MSIMITTASRKKATVAATVAALGIGLAGMNLGKAADK
jgi:hypothetical protein